MKFKIGDQVIWKDQLAEVVGIGPWNRQEDEAIWYSLREDSLAKEVELGGLGYRRGFKDALENELKTTTT